MSSRSYSDYESSLAAIAEVVDLRLGPQSVGPNLLASLVEVGSARDKTTRAEIKAAVLATLWHAATDQVRRYSPEEFRVLQGRVWALAQRVSSEVDDSTRDLSAVRKRLEEVRRYLDGWGTDPPVLLGHDDSVFDYASDGVHTFASVSDSLRAVVMADEEAAEELARRSPDDRPLLARFSDFVEHLESIEFEGQAELNALRARLDLLMARDQVLRSVATVYETLGDVPPYGAFVPLDPPLWRAHIRLLVSNETYVLSEIADEIQGGARTVAEAHGRVAAELEAVDPNASLAVKDATKAAAKLNKLHNTTVEKMKSDGRRSMSDKDGRRSSAADLSGRRLTVSVRPGGRPTIDP